MTAEDVLEVGGLRFEVTSSVPVQVPWANRGMIYVGRMPIPVELGFDSLTKVGLARRQRQPTVRVLDAAGRTVTQVWFASVDRARAVRDDLVVVALAADDPTLIDWVAELPPVEPSRTRAPSVLWLSTVSVRDLVLILVIACLVVGGIAWLVVAALGA